MELGLGLGAEENGLEEWTVAWTRQQAQRLTQQARQGRLPLGLGGAGPAGLGKSVCVSSQAPPPAGLGTDLCGSRTACCAGAPGPSQSAIWNRKRGRETGWL